MTSSTSRSKALILLLLATIMIRAPWCSAGRDIRSIPFSGPSTMVLGNVPSPSSSSFSSSPSSSSPNVYKELRNHQTRNHQVFGRKEVKNCLPKGFRHTSAPSRFVNYQPLGSCA